MARAERTKTRHVGVYERQFLNNHGKIEIAYDITYKIDGRKIWECVGTRKDKLSPGVAARIRLHRIEDKDKGELVLKNDIPTLSEAWELYREKHLSGKIMEKTDIGLFENHINRKLGKRALNKIRPIDIISLKKDLENTPKQPPKTNNEKILKKYEANPQYLSPQTIAHIIKLIGRIYRACIKWGVYQGRNPVSGVTFKKIDNKRERYLTAEEAQKLLTALSNSSPQWHDISLLSLYSGMRLREILDLKVHQVNFDSKIIYVMDAKAGTRSVFLNEFLIQMLKNRIEHDYDPDRFVFMNQYGERIKYISTVFQRAADRLFNQGITDRRHKVVFHTLRHTFGSWLAQKGVALYTIGELMGHATVEMTKRYAKLSPDTKREAIDLLT